MFQPTCFKSLWGFSTTNENIPYYNVCLLHLIHITCKYFSFNFPQLTKKSGLDREDCELLHMVPVLWMKLVHSKGLCLDRAMAHEVKHILRCSL